MADSMTSPHVYPEGCVFNSLDDIAGKKITIMGLGLNGGGEACVRFFLKHGAFVTVTDMKTAEQLSPTLNKLNADCSIDKSRLTYILGQHRIEDFESADCVIKNPGVKYEGNKYLAVAKAIETDISIFLHFTKAPIIAVTGSKGKSSTVSAIHYGLQKAGFTSFLGGNITVSPLTFLEQTNEISPVVLELSSWQLRDLRGRKALKPKIAIITKTVPDHQNFYGSMKAYIADKRLIYADQTKTDYTILDADADGYLTECDQPKENCMCWGDDFATETKATVLRYSRKPFTKETEGSFQDTDASGRHGYVCLRGTTECVMDELAVPGTHNRINVLNAGLVMRLLGITASDTKRILESWGGIEHRLEFFHEWTNSSGAQIRFYNDSAATVPEAAVAAASSFAQLPSVILLTGGTDKQLDFNPLADYLCNQQKKNSGLDVMLLAGTGTNKLTSLLSEKETSFTPPYASLQDMLESLHSKLSVSKTNTTVVFSPGATSFGMFANEFDRGNQFKAKIKELFV